MPGVELAVQPPAASTDAPKLLAAGRTDFAILDIHDLAIARERGLDIVAVAALVQRPLAAVIARADGPVRRPSDLEGRRVGVTGLPSDDAVVDSEVAADGGDPARVGRVTIGFNAVSSLAAGKVDAATGFWNAEALALSRRGVPVRAFRVDRYGAPRYPELVLVTSGSLLEHDPGLVRSVAAATARGYAAAVPRSRRRPRRPAGRESRARPIRAAGPAAGIAAGLLAAGPPAPGSACRLGRLGPRAWDRQPPGRPA